MKNPRTISKKKPRLTPVVCKPCWELKYCPYGPLVELFPHPGEEHNIRQIKKLYKESLNLVKAGSLKSEKAIRKVVQDIIFLNPRIWQLNELVDTTEMGCSVFGHICPVFLVAEPFTETREMRRIGRTIPKSIMFQVVRRDGQVCRICRRNIPDNEVEFDHIIPFARGGPTTADNLRLLCRECNRKKSGSVKELLEE
jgi:hypothetical protein